MDYEEMRLDGNAAGGMLREVFVQEMTAALATCAGCGTTGPVGVLLEYGLGMGIILRCPKCDAPLLRIARAPDRLYVDFSGVRMLMIPVSASLA
jgi:hypothetical protein